MDACKKCAIVFENSVAALEVIGSQSIQAQVTGKVPIVNGRVFIGCLIQQHLKKYFS